MIDLSSVEHHPAMEELVDVLRNKTQNNDRSFFQAEVAYFLGKMAASMRATIVTKDRGEIPVNVYALALANSGYGKGHSVNIMETEILGGFRTRFMEDTLPAKAEESLQKIADQHMLREPALDPDSAMEKAKKEYNRKGAYPFTFDSGTGPAVKQLRQKLLMAEAGSINLQIDEIGLNMLSNVEVLTMFLELYDQGLVKQKLTKNTNDNEREEDRDGKTPTNLLLFGTPSKLLDGSQTEEEFYSFLETGYARRCFFGWGVHSKANQELTAEEIYQRLLNPTNSQSVSKWSTHFANLADISKFGWKMIVDDDVAIKLIEYRIQCEKQAETLPDHDEIRKAELTHRYFKALKLAGAYAFIDENIEITVDNLLQAIKLTEESGEAFQKLLNREKPYAKLAKYIATCGVEVTHADLHEALPFYKQSNTTRNELMALAQAWGYKHRIVIKKSFVDGIEFYTGETLEKTDLDELILSYSSSWAFDYLKELAPFDQLHVLLGSKDMHWANHAFEEGHRTEEKVIPGFNLVVVDVDGGTPLATAMDLLKEYTYLIHTTKRHTNEENRFRLILPINYKLLLDAEEYKEFMNNIITWLPFKVDEQANQRARKWLTHENCQYKYNEGELLDALPFIPKTSKNEQFLKEHKAIESLNNLERWFAQRIAQGNRNNNMLKFALALADSGMRHIDAERAVQAFNDKLNTPLSRQELSSTVLVTLAKRYSKP